MEPKYCDKTKTLRIFQLFNAETDLVQQIEWLKYQLKLFFPSTHDMY